MAVKNLYILRHGKSSWANAEQQDFDRPLNDRGTRAARKMGREAARRGLRPDAILCSPAVRTTATLALFAEGWSEAGGPTLPHARLDPAFYLAEAPVWLEHARMLDDCCSAALLIGHNPGLHDLTLDLTKTSDGEALKRFRDGFPTCALAVLTFDGDGWDAVAPRSGHLDALLLPKQLKD